ncbi:MAG: DUF3772 domain-containing protein, partial [Pseudomonadota bacterium]
MDLMRFFLVLWAVAVFWVSASQAQTNIEDITEGVQLRSERIEVLSQDLDRPDANLIDLRNDIRSLKREAETQTTQIRANYAEVQADLERIGPAPEETDPPELEVIAEERSRLRAQAALLNGTIRQSDLNIAEVDRLLQEIADKRREQFSNTILARSASLLSPALWGEASARMISQGEVFLDHFTRW